MRGFCRALSPKSGNFLLMWTMTKNTRTFQCFKCHKTKRERFVRDRPGTRGGGSHMILYPSGLLITDFGTIEDGVLLALDALSRAAGKKKRMYWRSLQTIFLKWYLSWAAKKTLDTPRLVSIFKIRILRQKHPRPSHWWVLSTQMLCVNGKLYWTKSLCASSGNF